MKHRIASLAWIALTTSCLSHGQLSLGVRGGVNWANAAFTPDEKFPNREVTGAHVLPAMALIAEVPLSDRFSLSPELGYTPRGYRWLPSGPWATGTRYGFNYVDLNVLGILRLGKTPARPHLTAGISAGQLMRAESLAENKHGKVTGTTEIDIERAGLVRSQFSALAGAGFTFSAGRSLLALELRYAYGFTDVWNGITLTDLNGATIRTLRTYERSLSLHLSWRMPLKKRPIAE